MNISPNQALLFQELRLTIVSLILNNNRIAEQLGVNTTDLQVLQLVELRGTITPRELANELDFTAGGITVVLDRLEKAKFIKRIPNPVDRRSLLITLGTPRQIKRLADSYANAAQSTLGVAATYTNDELTIIARFMKEMREASFSLRVDKRFPSGKC